MSTSVALLGFKTAAHWWLLAAQLPDGHKCRQSNSLLTGWSAAYRPPGSNALLDNTVGLNRGPYRETIPGRQLGHFEKPVVLVGNDCCPDKRCSGMVSIILSLPILCVITASLRNQNKKFLSYVFIFAFLEKLTCSILRMKPPSRFQSPTILEDVFQSPTILEDVDQNRRQAIKMAFSIALAYITATQKKYN